jgi:hypothetical protein
MDWHRDAMSMAELMREVANLPVQQQNELAAYLLHLRLQLEPGWRSEMTRRLDARDPSSWVSLDDWKKEVDAGGEK